MKIIGISAFYHDSAAALLIDGKIVSAAQEERFSRVKHDSRIPINAVNFLLESSNLKIDQIDKIIYYENSFLKLKRIFRSLIDNAPKSIEIFQEIAESQFFDKKVFPQLLIKKALNYDGNISSVNHHQSHAASAFYPSPFKSSAFLTIDGVGEMETTTFGLGEKNKLDFLNSIHFPHSLGLMYAAFTEFLGFKVNSGEYKVMGLAPYGKGIHTQKILDEMIDIKNDGSFQLNMKYFSYPYSNKMTNKEFANFFKRAPRNPETKLTQDDMDLAKSIQEVLEFATLKIAAYVAKTTESKNICLAGGVALNCVSNGKILKEKIYKGIWIQPAAGDAGNAIGCALFEWHQNQNNPREISKKNWRQIHSYLGPSYNKNEIKEFLDLENIPYTKPKNINSDVAKLLAKGKIIGWFSGRMEFGPRALGARSILGDPRVKDMQKRMNLKIKYRESFRPFAPAIIRNEVKKWFNIDQESPFMLLVTDINENIKRKVKDTKKNNGLKKINQIRSSLPGITHVDYSARIQTVSQKTNKNFYALLKEFKKITECPILINTSFNVRGEPIVNTLQEAYNCLLNTDLDYLVLENFLIKKHTKLSKIKIKEHLKNYALD